MLLGNIKQGGPRTEIFPRWVIDGGGAAHYLADHPIYAPQLIPDVSCQSLIYQFGKCLFSSRLKLRCNKIKQLPFANDVLAGQAKPFQFGIIDPDIESIGIQRMIATRSIVVKILQLRRSRQHFRFQFLIQLLQLFFCFFAFRYICRHADHYSFAFKTPQWSCAELPYPLLAPTGRDNEFTVVDPTFDRIQTFDNPHHFHLPFSVCPCQPVPHRRDIGQFITCDFGPGFTNLQNLAVLGMHHQRERRKLYCPTQLLLRFD